MKQITESYVSYEIAVLLKENGFDEPVREHYYPNGFLSQLTTEWNNWNESDNISAPTHQMALKWLREVHNQIITIKYGNVGFKEESILQWWWELLNTKGELHACNIVDGNKSYEEACEDSILYVLKNLI